MLESLRTPHPRRNTPIPYTGSPLLLCLSDIAILLSLTWAIPGILSPIFQYRTGALDELYPSLGNLFSLLLHGILLILQFIFLLTLPLLLFLPLWTASLYLVAFFALVFALAYLLNGPAAILHSTVDLGPDAQRHTDECWIYLNGVSVGKHWLQSNLERLALTFRRPVTGVHNRTYGIIFDVLQCIIERDFCYATTDVRRSYVAIKERILSEEYNKVVLILHSQGGIEGGLILDWLLTELPHNTLSKLEIYTFGSAANHFNNPPRYAPSPSPSSPTTTPHAIAHIEHYASTTDLVACWGVLYFSALPNRYAGRVFVRPGTGHLLNQHYLNAMFPLDGERRVKEENDFMDMEVRVGGEGDEQRVGGEGVNEIGDGTWAKVVGADVQVDSAKAETGKRVRVRDLSRLWEYRNGGSPGE